MSTDTQQIINKAWNFAHVLRDDGLRQSVLKRAFAGKLVPQDPKDEPASVLLERIRTDRQGQRKQNLPGKQRRCRARVGNRA
jgi:type I restriction enzyme, S subunit